MPENRSLFVLMPFGKREIALENERPSMDFDAFYHEVIRPAAIATGWYPTRADELVGPDSIVRSIVGALSGADAVLGDLTSVNGNVLYELGVWHALGTGPTLLTARRGTSIPFDVRHERILLYEDPEVADNRKRALAEITRWLKQLPLAVGTSAGNPIEGMLTQYAMRPVRGSFEADKELRLRIDRADSPEKLLAAWGWGRGLGVGTGVRLELAEKLGSLGAYDEAVSVLGGDSEESDYELLQRRALFKRRADDQDLAGAEADLRRALELNPDDPEGLGLLGGVLRRQGDLAGALKFYQKARRMSPSSVHLRAAEAELTLLLGDHKSARLKYMNLLRTADRRAFSEPGPWDNLVAAEAAFVLGRDNDALDYINRAKSLGATINQLTSLDEQLVAFADSGWRSDAARVLVDALGLVETTSLVKINEPPIIVEENRSIQIIHISDIHFGKRIIHDGKHPEYQDMHYFPENDENTFTLRETLGRDLLDLARNGQIDLTKLVLVASGDFTYRGHADEFNLASSFLLGLCSDIGLPRERVVMVPGNHDVNWDAAKTDPATRLDDYLAFVRGFYGDAIYKARYPHIAKAIVDGAPHIEPRDIVSISDLFGFGFVGLNSTVFEDDRLHFGFIGKRQIDSVERDVTDLLPPGTPLVAVMHHHLHPYPEVLKAPKHASVWLDPSIVRDSGVLEKTLARFGTVVLLHGHKHQAQVRQSALLDRHTEAKRASDVQLVVNGAGSIGVVESELKGDEAHQYAVIDIDWHSRSSFKVGIRWRELGLWSDSTWSWGKSWSFVR